MSAKVYRRRASGASRFRRVHLTPDAVASAPQFLLDQLQEKRSPGLAPTRAKSQRRAPRRSCLAPMARLLSSAFPAKIPVTAWPWWMARFLYFPERQLIAPALPKPTNQPGQDADREQEDYEHLRSDPPINHANEPSHPRPWTFPSLPSSVRAHTRNLRPGGAGCQGDRIGDTARNLSVGKRSV